MLSELMNDSLSITQMYTSSREMWKINQSLGDTDLGFCMCPFSVSIHIQYTRITILVAHQLKNLKFMSHLLSFTSSSDYLRHYYDNSRWCLSLGFEPKFNYSLSDKIPLRMHHIPHCVLQTLKFPQRSFAPTVRCFLPFTSKYFLCECFCHLIVFVPCT